jgi:hypothetical protein
MSTQHTVDNKAIILGGLITPRDIRQCMKFQTLCIFPLNLAFSTALQGNKSGLKSEMEI